MKYIVYLTINNINNKIYIGVHRTENPDVFDGYIGCGVNIYNPSTIKNPKTKFQQAVKKYGFNNFKRITIAVFNNEEDALYLESILVNSKFLERVDVYNVATGGIINDTTKPINKFSLQGELLEHYESIKEASNKNDIWDINIINAYKNKKSLKDYFWALEDNININDYKLVKQQKNIYMFDTNFNLIKIYDSLREAAESNDCTRDNIKNAIRSMSAINKKYFSYNNVFDLKYSKDLIIYKYSMEGDFISKDSLINYATQLNVSIQKLYKTANSGLTLAGFQWNIMNPIKMVNLTNRQNVGTPKKVGQYTTNGELVKIFNTVSECKKEYTNVVKVLNGKLPTTKGYAFKYIIE